MKVLVNIPDSAREINMRRFWPAVPRIGETVSWRNADGTVMEGPVAEVCYVTAGDGPEPGEPYIWVSIQKAHPFD